MFKTHELYTLYISYIENMNISFGSKKIFIISESSFLNFENRYLNEVKFKLKVDNISRISVRDNKINKVLNDITI